MTEKVKTDIEKALTLSGPGGLLALDIAGTTGAAYGFPGGEPQWWTERIANEGADAGAVYARFDAWLNHLLHTLAPRRVFAELAFVGPHVNAVMRLAGYKAIVQLRCFASDRYLKFVPPKQITSFFVGRHANENKKAATIRVCKSYGWHTHSDDEADALAIWAYAEYIVDPKAHKDRVDRLRIEEKREQIKLLTVKRRLKRQAESQK